MNSKSSPYTLDEIFKNIIEDLTPFKNFFIYWYIFLSIFSFTITLMNVKHIGLLPFSHSMINASGEIRLLNDFIILSSILFFLMISFIHMMRGMSLKTKNKLVKHEKWFIENGADEIKFNRKIFLSLGSIFFFICPYLWAYYFGFTEGGNARLMIFTLRLPELVILFIMILGSIANLFLLFFAITIWESSKNVM